MEMHREPGRVESTGNASCISLGCVIGVGRIGPHGRSKAVCCHGQLTLLVGHGFLLDVKLIVVLDEAPTFSYFPKRVLNIVT